MNRQGKVMFAMAATLVAGGLVLAQQPGGGRFGGGGRQADPVSLLQNPQIKKELGITEDQEGQIGDAVFSALKKVLKNDQVTRLRQIMLQMKGTQAYLDPAVQKELSLTDRQVNNIKTIMEDSRKEMADMFKGGGGRDAFKKIAELRQETTEKINGVLTADQRRAYKQMLGEEFKMERPTFNFPGGGQGKGKGKFEFKKKKGAD